MNEAVHEAASPVRTAGGLLREARLAQGVHIAALAAAMKVPQHKLEALEADRLDELPDATFTRALAQAVCRALKTEPAPVLALLPGQPGHRLEHVAEGLKQPFNERAGRIEPSEWAGGLSATALWGVLGIALLTAVVWLLPQQWLSGALRAPAASAPPPASTTLSTAVPAPTATPAPVATPADATWAPAAASGVLPAIVPSAEPSAAPPAAPNPQ